MGYLSESGLTTLWAKIKATFATITHTHGEATTTASGMMSSSDKTKLDGIASGAEVNVQADWSVTDTSSDAYIANKPSIPTQTSDLTNDSGFITGETDPTVPAWAKAATKPSYTYSEISDTPTLAAVATSGSYNDLENKPTIPTYNFSGTTFYSGASGTAEHNANNAVKNGHYYYTSNGPATSIGPTSTDGALYVQSYSDSWVSQIAQDYRNGHLYVRGKNNGTWQGWKTVPTVTWSTTDLTAGSSTLATGQVYFVYE